MRICSLFGHRELWGEEDFDEKLENALICAIENLGITDFYVGDYGKFDLFSALCLRRLKKKYPHIKIILVLAYLDKKYSDADKEFNKNTFDEIIYPPIESVHRKFAIFARNKWMVDTSDFVIFYVNCSYGGAYRTYEYAFRKKKNYINIGTKKDL